MYPAYNIVAGAITGDNNAKLAQFTGEISSRDLPEFTISLFKEYLNIKEKYTDFNEYFENQGKEDIKKLCKRYEVIPDFEEDKNYYFDWGSENIFSLIGKGVGECSAGIFDMIDFDLNSIKDLKEEIKIYTETSKINKLLTDILFHSSRMLLVTRGIEPKSRVDVFDGFIDKFINSGLIKNDYRNIVETAREKNTFNFLIQKELIYDLAKDVKELYECMDDSLQFNIPDDSRKEIIKDKEISNHPTRKKDFRGVVCPMNFVKTKIELASLKPGDVLEILLDDGEPIENVPGSVKSEGHKILEQKRIENYWSVLIKKS